MKNNFMIISLLVLLSIIATCVNLNSQNYTANQNKSNIFKDNESFTIKGLDKISDPEFKKVLSQYLFLNEKNDYKQLYNLLSKEFLQEYFPNIKNAEEYATRIEDISEVSEFKYMEITKIQYQNNQYKVDIIASGMAEGERIKVKTTYFFIKEDTGWKYNGLDVKSYQELK